ncbi:DNA repair protein RecN [Sphingobacterium suaedae]|uniref:DNA repair protein RecN n=1 Tax=Sphingobacterium suaedae TaxID=1686402 RepID=A0ABW5KI70_9SPHI
MLSRLYIKNYALIENLDIQFDAGLNIITGETGAGKSIIMGALGLILGNRAEGKHFFNDEHKCVIEGFFKIDAYNIYDFFQDNELEYESETIIRREVSIDGKSRAFVNDSPVTLSILKALGELLIDIHSQHGTLQLNMEPFQLMVLDSVAKNQDLLSIYKKQLQQYRDLNTKLIELRQAISANNAELDFNQFQFDELNDARLKDGEQEKLEEELNQLENTEEIKRGLGAAGYLLVESEQSVIQSLKETYQQLVGVQRYAQPAGELAERVQSVLIEIKDVADEVVSLEQTMYMDEGRLAVVNERLSVLYNLLKKHRVDAVSDLILLRDQLEEKIRSVTNQEDQLQELCSEVNRSLAVLERTAEALHQSRLRSVAQVEQHVQQVLAEVGMQNAQLKVALKMLPVDKYRTTGADEIQFLFSANKGQPLQLIHRVASGGELSRVMLAVKSLVAKTSALPTIIFDEIDTGISGEVALKVGEIMENLSLDMQVMAITHLPQIASKGSSHFKVYKRDVGDKTKTNIVLLQKDERVVEVAQMLSGATPGESALKHAKELLEN